MASMKQDVTVGYSPTKASGVTQVSLSAGDPVTVVKEWAEHYLIKTSDGKLFNVKKELVEP